MNDVKSYKIMNAVALSADRTSAAVRVKGMFGLFIQAIVSAGSSPSGALKLQYSNLPTEPGASDASWTDIPTDTSLAPNGQTVSANGSKVWEYPKVISFEWIRVVYTRTSGSGTLNVYLGGNK